MSFIVDNYIWFIIAGFVLLMITIGYYAEKTNFGKKQEDKVDFDNNDAPIIPNDNKRLLDVTSQSQITKENEVANNAVPEVIVNNPFVDEDVIETSTVLDNPVSQTELSDMPIQIPEMESNLTTNSNVNSNDFPSEDVWKF